MTTLMIDTGQTIVGIFCVEDNEYVPYSVANIMKAIRRIETADEVVTYNGTPRSGTGWYDLKELGRFAGLAGELPLQGVHTDMRSICWSDRILGSNLTSTYELHSVLYPEFSDSYDGSNQRDVYMTFKLWEFWKQGKLRVIDGHYMKQ